MNQRNETHHSRFPLTNIQIQEEDRHVNFHHPNSYIQQRYGNHTLPRTQQSPSENYSRPALPTPSRLFESSEYQVENPPTFQDSNSYKERPRHRTEIFETPGRYYYRQTLSSSYETNNQEYCKFSTMKTGQERHVPTFEVNYPTADSTLHHPSSENQFHMNPNFGDIPLEDSSFLPQASHNNRDDFVDNLDRFSASELQDVYEHPNNIQQQEQQEQIDPYNPFQLTGLLNPDSNNFMKGETELAPDEDLIMPSTNQVSTVGVRSASRPESGNRKRSWDRYYSDGYRLVRNENIDPVQTWEVPPHDSFDVPLFDSSPDIEKSQPSGGLRWYNNGVQVDQIGNPLDNSRYSMAHTNRLEEKGGYDYRPARKRRMSSPENDSFQNFVS
jgi:hypothetical protein